MFEKIISDLLTKFLGDYVEGLNSETFTFAVWSGSVELKNLKIKKEALKKFNIPFDIKSGILGLLEIKIPWRNLSKEPVVLTISDISIIIGPRKQVAWSAEDEQKEIESQKAQKLVKLEKQKLEKRIKEIEGEKNEDTFASKFASKIIESVQIFLANIHIRYEDDRDPNRPFSLGITLDNGFAKTSDFEDEIDGNIINKLITLQNLAIYWNDFDRPIEYRSDDELVQKMSRLIYKDSKQTPKNKYIGGPICGSLKIKLLKNFTSLIETIPKITLSFIFEAIQLKLSENQLIQLIKLLEWILHHKHRQRLTLLKPKIPIKQDPLSWWRFALENATREFREKKKRFNLAAISLRRERRLEYIKLWTQKITDNIISPRLAELEDILPYEDITYFRYLAEAKFTPQQLVKKKKSSWFSWFDGAEQKQNENESFLTPEQQDYFLKSIGYYEHPKDEIAPSDITSDYVKLKASLILEKIIITLEGTENGEIVTLAEATATQFKIGASVRKSSLSLSASLEKIKLEDFYSKKTSFPVLIQSYQIAGSPTPDHFFTMQLDVHPPSSEKEFDLNMRIEGIDIVINIPWILRLVKMFKKPWQENSSSLLEKEVGKKVTTIKHLSYIQVKHLVEKHKQFGVNITACAPRLILPEEATDKHTSLIVVDLGDLLITSQGQSNVEFTEDSRWQDHLYDQYLLNLTGLQVLLMNYSSWKKVRTLNNHTEEMTVIEKFDINISLGTLMIPETDQLSKIRLSGFLPHLEFKFSGLKIRDLLRVLITLGDDDPPDPLPELVPLYEIEEPALDVPLPDELDDYDAPVSSIYNKILECHFSIGEVFLHLSRNEENGKEKPIILGVLEGLVVQYVLRVKDMVAYIGVHSISMEDLLLSNGEKFRYLATSLPPNNLYSVQETDEDLIKIAYERVKVSSPDFKNIENQVDLSFSSLYVNFNRQTIVVLLDILNTAFLSDKERKYQRRIRRLKEWGMHPDQLNKSDVHNERIEIGGNIIMIEEKVEAPKPVKKEPPKSILIKLTATLKTIGFSIIKDEDVYSFISLTNTSVQYQMHDSITDIKGSLGGVRIEDLSPHAHFFPQIMSPLQNESMIQFTYREYNPNFADYPGYKDKLRMKVNSINFVLVQRFIFDVAKIFSEMSDMKKPANNSENSNLANSGDNIPGSTESNENKLTPMEVFEQRSRFEIMIVNLKLLVPKNSISPEFVQLDMGTISLFNTHFAINEEERIFGERMSFCMHEANCTIGSALDPGKLHTIIDNLNMIFEFERAKGDDPKHEKIPFKFTGEVDHLRARVTEKQYALFINTIRQNVSERSLRANKDTPPPPEPSANDKKDKDKLNMSSGSNGNNSGGNITALDEIITTFAMGINIHKVSMELLQEDTADPDILHSFAYGEMENFMYTLVNTSDSTTRMDYSWETISIIDTRPSSENKFTKLWGDEDEIKRTEPQFRFFWTSDHLNRKKLSIKLNKIRMVMVPLVYTIKGFFTTNLMSGDLPQEIIECFPNAPPPLVIQQAGQISELIDLDEVEAEFILNLIVSDIVMKFPENWEDENSRGVIASADFLMKLTSHQGQTGFRGFVENLQINNCVLRKEAETMVRILKPINVSFNSNSCPRESNVSIILEPIIVAFSYRDFKVLMAIAKCLTPPAAPVAEVPSVASSQQIIISPPIIQQQNLSLTTGGLKLTLIDDLKGHNVPLLNMKIFGLTAGVDNWSSALYATFNFKVQSDYYNVEIAHWEPLIEPWGCSLKWVKTPILDTNPPAYDSKISVSSQDFLNMNVSKIFFNTIKSSVSSWTDDYNNNLNFITNQLEYSLVIRNCTGSSVSYWVDPEVVYQLQDGQEEPLATIEQHILSDREAEIDELANKSITIQIAGGWDALEHLPVNRIGSWVISLTPKPNNGDTRIVYSIEYKDGYKLITIRSNVMVVNSCHVPIDICIDIPHKERVILNPIPADSTYFIPIQFALVGNIRVKPSNMPEYDYCSPHIPCNPTESSTISIQCGNSLNVGGFGSHWYFSGSIDIRKVNQKGRHVISISAPLRIDNLLAEDVAVSIYKVGGNSELFASTLKRGESLHSYSIPHRKMAEIAIHLPDKFGKSKRECLDSNLVQARVYDFKNRELILFIENSVNEEGTNVSSIYAKYWLVNKVGLPILFMQKSKIGSEKELAAGLADVEKLYETIGPNMQYTSMYSDLEKNTVLSAPLMYSYSDLDIFGNKTSIKIANSKWSKPISLESVGTNGSVSVNDTDSKLNYHVGVEIELLTGRFHRTKKITFRPRYVLVNKLDRTLYYKQKDTKARYILEAGKELPFHWFDKDQTPELSITFSDTHNWSTPFSISEITEFAIKIAKEGDSKLAECYLARIEIQLHNSTLFVLFKPEARDVPPYRIENCTNEEIIFYQKGSNIRENLQPMLKEGYTWDLPGGSHRLIITIPALQNYKQEFNLDKIRTHDPIEILMGKEKAIIKGRTFIDGPTRVLRITDISRMEDGESYTYDSNLPSSHFEVEIAGAGISLIDNTPQELLYISLSYITYDFGSTISEQIHEFRIKEFQIDNQMLSTSFPVMVSSTPAELDGYFFHLGIVKSNFFTTIDYFHYFSFLMQEIHFKADDMILNHLLSFVQVNYGVEPNFEEDLSQQIIVPKPSAKKLYIELLKLSPIKCYLTFNYSSSERKVVDQVNQNPVKTVLNAIGVTVANIEDAPIYLNSLNINHAFHTREEMITSITKHYYFQLLSEVYKVVFSFDIIGNPVSLVHNLGTGVYDFFYEPAKGFVKSPKEFVIGVRKGSTSLVKNSVAGIFNTASKITGSLSKGVAHLAFDKEYVRQREKNNREKAKHVGQGISLGAKELGTGLFKGITGVVTAPISGAKREGVGGMIKGLGKGVIGAAVKPGVGIFDMCTRTTEGIKNFVTISDNNEVRVRPPRGFGPDKVLFPYDREKAIGQSILRSLDQSSYEDHWHLFHCISLQENLVLVSNKKIFYINVGEQDIQWSCDIADIESIKAEISQSNKIRIKHKNPQSSNWPMRGGQKHSEPFVRVIEFAHADTARWLENKLRTTKNIISRFEKDEDDLAFSV